MKAKFLYPIALLALPVLTFAQDATSILSKVQNIIASLVPILIGIAVLYFLWGVLKYVVAKDPESQKEARSIMIYGIIVLFVMVSIWGLVGVLARTVGISNSGRAPESVRYLIPQN